MNFWVGYGSLDPHRSTETAIGGGVGDIGKKINHGGGDGGEDDGDDDDYFDDFVDGDEGDEGGLFRRHAVLNKWQKTMMDLPAGFRQAYEMICSSEFLLLLLLTSVKFLAAGQ
uniref:Uncharacterized protein n=1 Tax=Quercus lobata TaxID=97700 RepID=A0A7N2R425_QUELO